jgi:hypothetical protein
MHDEFQFNFRDHEYTANILYYSPSQSATYQEPGYDAEIEFEVFRGRHLVRANWDADAILRMYEDDLREERMERNIRRMEEATW